MNFTFINKTRQINTRHFVSIGTILPHHLLYKDFAMQTSVCMKKNEKETKLDAKK